MTPLPKHIQLKHVDGNLLESPISKKSIDYRAKRNERINFNIRFENPKEPGQYHASYQLVTRKGEILVDNIYVSFEVEDPASQSVQLTELMMDDDARKPISYV